MAPRVVYYAAATLDGMIAEPEEKLTWLTGFSGGLDSAGQGLPMKDSYPEFFEGVGAMVMGSKTYEFMHAAGSWPYGDTPCRVFTTRELEPLEAAADLRFVSGPVDDHHAELAAAAGAGDVWLVGGGRLASQYLDAGLLDELRVTVVPIVLGAGLPLFAAPVTEPMRLAATRPFANGMVELTFEIPG